MRFASLHGIGVLLAVILCSAVAADVVAQGRNPYVLTNGGDTIILGVGAGTDPITGDFQAKGDGLGTWIAGEDLQGSHRTAQTNDFGFRLSGYRESVCVQHIPAGGPGALVVKFRSITFWELDGTNANNQKVFLNPACTSPTFPLGGGDFIPYGIAAGETDSFFLNGVGTPVGPTASSAVLLPNHGVAGTADIVCSMKGVTLPIPATGCYVMQFDLLSSVALHDHIDGLWHYVINSDDNNQYWVMSDDELNIWQSNSVALANGQSSPVYFFPNIDYDLLLFTPEPVTVATLAPRGMHDAGPYYTQTEKVGNISSTSPSLNPNGGFDVGRGSAAISFSGTAGVANVSGIGNQNPANNSLHPATVGTLGFATWDNGGDFNGSVRVTWLSIDFHGAARSSPDTEPSITKAAGTLRLPLVAAGLLQPVTNVTVGLWQHVTGVSPSGWPDPQGLPSGSFGISAIGGASQQFVTGPLPSACVGIKLNLTYGTSGRLGDFGGAGALTWNPANADVSGKRELYLFN